MVYRKEINHRDFPETIEVPCESCGKSVTIALPFTGCVYCGECASSGTNYKSIGSEQFTPKYKYGRR